jgi:hypothetical protein
MVFLLILLEASQPGRVPTGSKQSPKAEAKPGSRPTHSLIYDEGLGKTIMLDDVRETEKEWPESIVTNNIPRTND